VARLWWRSKAFFKLANHLGRQGETEPEEGLVELFSVDQAGVVTVEAEENPVPVLMIRRCIM